LRPLSAIFDTSAEGGARAVRTARTAGVLTAVVDDASDRRLEADLAFYPPVPQAARLEWRGATAQRFVGWDWAVMGQEPLPIAAKPIGGPLNVLVTMGGSDPAAQTLPAVRGVLRVLGTHRVTVSVGTGFSRRADVVGELRQLPGPMEILDGVEDLRPPMRSADLAVAMFGVTAYELAAHGVPALYLTLTPDHAQSASAFVSAGMGRAIGPAGCGEAAIADAVRAMLADADARAAMSAMGPRTIDGRGASRIAAYIAERVQAAQGFRKAG
jgi:spore coat polysaccharide biosynthesis predicted glycosyltransferase SpsG